MLVAIVANTPSLLISQALPRGNVVSRRASLRMDAVAASEDAVANPVEEQIKSLVTSNAIELSRFESAMCLERSRITLIRRPCSRIVLCLTQHGGLLQAQGD